MVPGSSGEGSEGCFCGVLGRFRAFSDGYRATTPGKLMEMSPEGTGRVFGGSRGGVWAPLGDISGPVGLDLGPGKPLGAYLSGYLRALFCR